MSQGTNWALQSLCCFVVGAAASCAPPKTAVSVSVSSLGTAAADARGNNLSEGAESPASTLGRSHLLPVIDGMRVSFVDGLQLCTGIYGTQEAVCNAAILKLNNPVEVTLTQNAGATVNLTSAGELQTLQAGEYTHARIGLAKKFSIKAHFKNETGIIYTTVAGLKSLAEATEPGADYDFLNYDDLYPGVSDTQSTSAQETTFFSKPFAYDGQGTIDIKLLIDLKRAGRFDTSDASAEFVPAYPNIYVTLNQVTLSSVETFALAGDEASLHDDRATVLTLLFDGTGTFITGRSRYFDDMNVPPIGQIAQFIKDWECTQMASIKTCEFLAGDYGSNSFPQKGSGFVRHELDEGPGTFTLTSSEVAGASTVYYQRLVE